MKVLIIDDHEIIRYGIKHILSHRIENITAGEAISAKEALQLLTTKEWDIVILDIKLPDMNGLNLLKKIKAAYPNIPVLVVSAYHEKLYGMRALNAGAAGYLRKDVLLEQLVEAVQTVAKGQRYITPKLANYLVSGVKVNGNVAPHNLLTDREFEVFRMIGAGMTVSEIARDLSLSVKTISTHRTRILMKMNLKNNAEIARYVIESGLI